MVSKVADREAMADLVEIEFGLRLPATGHVIMAGVSGEAILRVQRAYDAKGRHAGLALGPQHNEPGPVVHSDKDQ
jgi:hypothetical protein